MSDLSGFFFIFNFTFLAMMHKLYKPVGKALMREKIECFFLKKKSPFFCVVFRCVQINNAAADDCLPPLLYQRHVVILYQAAEDLLASGGKI